MSYPPPGTPTSPLAPALVEPFVLISSWECVIFRLPACVTGLRADQLQETPAIEVAHVFNLGTKYTQAMGATFTDDLGKTRVMHMGCFGMGVTRLMATAAEISHDDHGIIWPARIAPYAATIVAFGEGPNLIRTQHAARQLYDALESGTFLKE